MRSLTSSCFFFFFFNDTATTEIYTLSLHDALPISALLRPTIRRTSSAEYTASPRAKGVPSSVEICTGSPEAKLRSEEHTSELQSQSNLVCRLLLEKKKNISILTCGAYVQSVE